MPPRLKAPTPLQHHMHAWRKHREMTLEQLGEAIGSRKSHLSLVERGVRGMTMEVAEAIAKALGITVEMLRNQTPGREANLEQEMMALFRGATLLQRRAMVEAAYDIRYKPQR